MVVIDTDHDFWVNYRTDNIDPDAKDPLLREYHRYLWSKPLPNGKMLALDKQLRHNSELGSFTFSSDSFLPSFLSRKGYDKIISQIPKDEFEYFYHIASTIGAITIFPANRVDGMMTINGEKGFNNKIGDRMDFTLECIKRHYNGGSSPMSGNLERYASFFSLFGDFKGYVDFFLMQDMVDSGHNVKFFSSFDDFRSSPLPNGVGEYKLYIENAIVFVKNRNLRIEKWAAENPDRL